MKRVVMEVDQTQRKYARISNGNGRFVTAIIDQTATGKMDDMYPDEDDDGEHKRRASNDAVRGGASAADLGGGVGRFYGGWPSSRIVRVSRATGGKDRHSKVLTSKGLRDRRVRLSVNTAIQFYDLQDRLGFDQPSKAVEWLLKAAASSITELPPMLNSPFPDTPKQLSDEKKSSTGGSNQLGLDSVDMDSTAVGDPSYLQQQQIATKSSACSSTSETSKGSGLSLSRSETRAKARERAKGRAADKKDKDNEPSLVSCLNLNPISQTSSFTELLSGGLNNGNTINHHHHHHQQNPIRGTTNESNFFLKSPKQWSSTMDYFTSGHFGHSDLQQFSFAQDHLIPVINAATGVNSNNNSNNLNFTISTSGNNSSTGLAAEFNRGTLQSNSTSLPSQLPHLQRFCPIDGSSQSFFTGAATPAESHHQFLSGYDAGRLQLYYGDAHDNAMRHAGHKGKGKH